LSSVTQILDRNNVVHTVDEIDFLCRRWGMSMALQAFGPGAFAIVDDGKVEFQAESLGNRAETCEKVLRAVMISPALGDQTDEENDVVSFQDLGDLAFALFAEVTGEVQADAAGFPESSAEKTED